MLCRVLIGSGEWVGLMYPNSVGEEGVGNLKTSYRTSSMMIKNPVTYQLKK